MRMNQKESSTAQLLLEPSFSPSTQTYSSSLGMRGRGVEGAEEGLASLPLQTGVGSPSFPPFPSPAPP